MPTEGEHKQRLRDERLAFAAKWLQPKLPPNCAMLTVKFHYDDGEALQIKASEKGK